MALPSNSQKRWPLKGNYSLPGIWRPVWKHLNIAIWTIWDSRTPHDLCYKWIGKTPGMKKSALRGNSLAQLENISTILSNYQMGQMQKVSKNFFNPHHFYPSLSYKHIKNQCSGNIFFIKEWFWNKIYYYSFFEIILRAARFYKRKIDIRILTICSIPWL